MKIKKLLTVVLCGFVLFGLAFFCWIKAPASYSNAERRSLAQLPKLTADTLASGRFMSQFEDYSMDQFPMRDGWRSLKAVVSKYGMGQKDNHGLYVMDGMVSKLEYPMNESRVNRSVKVLRDVMDTYIQDTECKVYLSIIPDKNYFMAPLGGYPMMDYDRLVEKVKDGVTATYVDIFDLLELSDYYNTDQHWRQEAVTDVAGRLAAAMNPSKTEADYAGIDYEENTLDNPFYGAYVGQVALPMAADIICYLTNEVLEGCTVTCYQSGVPQDAYIYDMTKAHGKDPYEMFLSGSDPLLVIENPAAESDKELVVFRDSFGSSLIPLMLADYRKVTVVDLRYMKRSMLGEFLEFDQQDVLFLYSTLILNNSISME